MAPYSRHVLVFTGQADWKSKIEDEHSTGTWGPLLAKIKKAFGRGGQYHDPYRQILVSACSWNSTAESPKPSCDILVFPDSVQARFDIREDNTISVNQVNQFCEFINGPIARDLNEGVAQRQQALGFISNFRDSIHPTILICSHGGRDSRCGVLGPLLHDQFRQVIRRLNDESYPLGPQSNFSLEQVNVGMISHIGGHKWAGNVIIYVPHTDQSNPLAGCGIWYGRVEPKHVDGIVRETLHEGRIVQDLFRGGIDRTGQVIRIP